MTKIVGSVSLYVFLFGYCFCGINSDIMITGMGMDSDSNRVPCVFFLCEDYRSCFFFYQITIQMPNVTYVCFITDEVCFLNGIQTDGTFESVGLNFTRNVLNETITQTNSFVKAFNTQCINSMTIKGMTEFCIRPASANRIMIEL
jgi:hypothetical protein